LQVHLTSAALILFALPCGLCCHARSELLGGPLVSNATPGRTIVASLPSVPLPVACIAEYPN